MMETAPARRRITSFGGFYLSVSSFGGEDTSDAAPVHYREGWRHALSPHRIG